MCPFDCLLQEHNSPGIRVVANAGGVNPIACSEALASLAHEQGVELNIATVTGDDLMDQVCFGEGRNEFKLQHIPFTASCHIWHESY